MQLTWHCEQNSLNCPANKFAQNANLHPRYINSVTLASSKKINSLPDSGDHVIQKYNDNKTSPRINVNGCSSYQAVSRQHSEHIAS